jgi:hypothetical protein
MSWIDGVGRPGLPRPARRTAGAGQGAFSVPSGSAAASARTAGVAASSAAALDGMLALQERGDGTVQDREARRRGQDLLGALSRMQRSILAGGSDPELLRDMVALTADLPRAADPGLRRVLEAIALRARVELARRGL